MAESYGMRMQVAVSPVMGKGFPVDRVPASDFDTMLIFATGTGISPIKALIDAGALDVQSRSDVRLYYGAIDTNHMAYLNRWAATGLCVRVGWCCWLASQRTYSVRFTKAVITRPLGDIWVWELERCQRHYEL